MIRKQIGLRLRELRLLRQQSQEKFALEAGLDRTYIASVEAGRRNVSIISLQKIWRTLNISAKDFFDSEIFRSTVDE